MKRYIDSLNYGKKIVIATSYNSEIFWKENNTYYCFNREFGTKKCSYMDDKSMIEYIERMLEEDEIIFVR